MKSVNINVQGLKEFQIQIVQNYLMLFDILHLFFCSLDAVATKHKPWGVHCKKNPEK